MASIFSMSVDTQKLDYIINYFDDKLSKDINRWHEAKDPLKNDLYDRIDEIAEEGKKIMEEQNDGDTEQ
jgi:hypothetical protein